MNKNIAMSTRDLNEGFLEIDRFVVGYKGIRKVDFYMSILNSNWILSSDDFTGLCESYRAKTGSRIVGRDGDVTAELRITQAVTQHLFQRNS